MVETFFRNDVCINQFYSSSPIRDYVILTTIIFYLFKSVSVCVCVLLVAHSFFRFYPHYVVFGSLRVLTVV